ncbi:MAG: TiaS agmantine-binding domain-containing protein [Thermoproteota archaeon]
MTEKTMHIGFDDTDSPRRGCTTYVAAVLVEKLQRLSVKFMDYPNLVRLNPNVPWKTRGNGALCLRIRYDEDHEEKIKECVISTVEEHADLEYEGTHPGIVFLEGSHPPPQVRNFAKKSITGIVNLGNALKILKEVHAEACGFKKNRGIIGGLAAVGEPLKGDHTFEILGYRTPENRGLERKVDRSSVMEMDERTSPHTFSNIDRETGRILITPGGPDPVLLGIRGENANIVKEAFEIVKPLEPVERWTIFRTNQGTDAHLKPVKELSQIEPYKPVVATGTVAEDPKIIPRRHVIFPLEDESTQVDCAAYEPTGALRKAARKLIDGDYIQVAGGVRPPSQDIPLTINLEKFRVLDMETKISRHNPVCPQCRKRLESMGRDQGFRCKKCGSRYPDLDKVDVELNRELKETLYITSPRSQRHLTKPDRRYGKEKRHARDEKLIENWHFP